MSAPDRGIGVFLNLLFGAEPRGAFVEARHKLIDRPGMGQRFFPLGVPSATVALHEHVAELVPATDVYVGVAPRRRQSGTRDAIENVHVLWADIDGAEPLDALRRFRPRPSMVIRSGSPDSVHAYWSLDTPVGPAEAERLNRRLAHPLGADMRSTDAARILRPPGTLNHKHDPPKPVEIAHLEFEVYTPEQIVGDLPDPPDVRPANVCRLPRAVEDQRDPLLSIEPPLYVEALTGQSVGRDGKVPCPLPDHEDRTPSCHVYDDPERGWYCYGCGRGGTIYDLASAISDLGTRGEEFRRLRHWLSERLLSTAVAA